MATMKVPIFTVIPNIGDVEVITFTFEDGTIISLQGDTKDSWMKEYAVLVNLYLTLTASPTAKAPQEQQLSESDKSIKEVFGK